MHKPQAVIFKIWHKFNIVLHLIVNTFNAEAKLLDLCLTEHRQGGAAHSGLQAFHNVIMASYAVKVFCNLN